ncbi:MAG TPA: hypothetical protein VFK41_08365 [Nocardioidaceae bacterium]|nr:hypothetical protein [Nocardioidaceae bacterium]
MSVAKLAIGGATLVSSSALWQAYQGSMPIETAATRFAIVLVVSWIALSVVAELVFPAQSSVPNRSASPATPHHPGIAHHDEVQPNDADQPMPAPPTSMPNP